MAMGIESRLDNALKEVIRDLLLNGMRARAGAKRTTRRTTKRKSGGARKISAKGRAAISRAAKARWRKYRANKNA